MSADRVKFIENVSAELEKRGCKKLEQLDDYNSLWVTEWGCAITVPDFGKQDKCPAVYWFDVLSDIERTRPPGK